MTDFKLTTDELDNFRNEGDAGLLSLDKMCQAMGYTDRFGSLMDNFLRDNPGCIEAIYDWVRNNYADKIEARDNADPRFIRKSGWYWCRPNDKARGPLTEIEWVDGQWNDGWRDEDFNYIETEPHEPGHRGS